MAPVALAFWIAAAPAAGAGQATPPPQAPPAAQQPEAAAPKAPAYSYSRDGRRDPFVSLIGRGDPSGTSGRPAGLPGLLINEVSLKGIVKQSGGFVAMLQGPDRKTYVVRPGQRLLDGSVKSITQDTVVFAQDVNDPLSLVKQREVKKTLRSSEEGRG
ncbi:MAG TPA: hypothetical protein VM364_00045 [Vicinamibacterales bacterium]|nr:hypothetical protein [Vicinamibacterales bacterium]